MFLPNSRCTRNQVFIHFQLKISHFLSILIFYDLERGGGREGAKEREREREKELLSDPEDGRYLGDNFHAYCKNPFLFFFAGYGNKTQILISSENLLIIPAFI